MTLPVAAQCLAMLADGRLLTITASRRPRANRADVKCVVAGAPAICERMQEVVRLARHTEPRIDSRDQVVLSMDTVPEPDERDWELAAVLADRMVRGLYRHSGGAVLAHGRSDAWHLGRVQAGVPLAIEQVRHHLADARASAPAPVPGLALVLGAGTGTGTSTGTQVVPNVDSLFISHLGGLHGHPDPAAAVASATAWFPLHSGGVNDCLGWVEVSVYPILEGVVGQDAVGQRDDASGQHRVDVEDEEDTIAVPGLDLSAQLAVRRALAGARHFDGRGLGRWRTVVRFGQPRFQGASYELALVMADRLARGRECVPRGRIIATGCSSAWHAGQVETVDGCAPKLALILKQAEAGDRVLLPAAWHGQLPDGFGAALRARGASHACIERIGMI
ncbi:hypothetical protein H3H37_11025 [Duganella sp. LX20W]|uniref:Uncharacterized protein n=1 Tax=Rugamonas brunnea TaxID=2758569 RepID=A0A7W2IBL3_9BURK|nr:hypothetical protein [Rugamonas brunnea]MBA5637586.1 hypothetical protein [Rugamonas brunnea]